MTRDEIKRLWLVGKEGPLEFHALKPHHVDHEDDGEWFECPCGGDHWAFMAYIAEGCSKFFSGILNCYQHGRQWLVRMPNVAAVIRSEEEKYLKIIERAPAIIAKVVRKRGWSEETLIFLNETHGIDPDLAREFYHDPR